MASSYTGLGSELMTTGENAGTWGTTTNTNLQILEQIAGGYTTQAVTTTTTLSVSDGSTGATLSHRVIKFTGTLSANATVTIPLDVQQMYILLNGTAGAYTLTFKYVSGSGSTVAWAATDKGTKLVYATADDGTNPNMVDSGIGSTAGHDLDGNEFILDADADTSITADTDDQIDIKIAGADDFQFTANTFTAQSGSTIAAQALTATTITASGIVKTDSTTAATSTTDGSLQTDGGLSVAADAVIGDDLKLLSDSAVLSFGADSDTTLTHTDGTGLTLNSTNKLCFYDTALSISSSTDGQLDIDADTEVEIATTTLDLNGALDVSGASQFSSTITVGVNDTGYDVKFFGATSGAYMLWDESTDDLVLAGAAKLYLYDAAGGEYLSSSGSALTIASGSAAWELPAADGSANQVLKTDGSGNLDWTSITSATITALNNATANELVTVGATTTELDAEANLTFDGTDVLLGGAGKLQLRDTGLYVASNADGDLDIVSDGTAVDSINLESAGGITLDAGTASSGIVYEDDGTEMLRVHNSSSDVIVESKVSNKDIIFKVNDGGVSTEVARFDGDVSAFLIASGKKLMIGAAEEYLSGDGTDISFTVGSGGDINIGQDIGLTFGNDGEKIEGDGTDLTISANNLTVDAAADINLDADGADVNIKDGGTTILSFTNSSSDAVITSGVQDKDIIFKGDDGGSAVTALTLDMSAGGIATFSAAANVTQQAITSSSAAVAWDASDKPNAYHQTTENTTISEPSNPVEGAFICLEINYNGSHTIGWNAIFNFAADAAPTTTDTDGKTDILVFRYNGAIWQEVGRTLNIPES